MKKKFYILMCLASLVLMVTACGGKEKIKEKLRAATEAVKERKEAAASEKGSDLEMDKQGDRPDNGAFVDPSLTPAQRKALDKENPWFARNFRMELTAKSMRNKVNVEIQKSGKILITISGTTLAMSRRLSCLTKAIIRFTRFRLKTRWRS